MALDFDALRAEVAKRHNLLLGKEDPILAVVTLNELVLEHFIERAEEAAADLERRGAQLMAQEVSAVKAAAEGMIAGASRYIAAEVTKAGSDAQSSMLAALDKRLAASDKAAATAQAAKTPALWAAAAAVAAALVTLGVAIGALVK